MFASPAWYFRAAVIYALVAMALGIFMAASGDHNQMPTHAHINLVGWVTIFLYGAFLKIHPGASQRLGAILWWIANTGAIIMLTGVYIIYSGSPETGEPLATVGAILTIIGAALFAVIVYRTPD